MSVIEELKGWHKEEEKQINYFRRREPTNKFFVGSKEILRRLKDKIKELEAREGKE